MDLFKILRPTWHTVWDTKCQRTWWTYRNHAKLSLRNVYNDINIMNDVGRKSMFFRHYTCYISNTYNGQYFLRSEFVTIFVKLLLNFVNALHPECGLCVFDPNVCLLYFETRAFYHVSTYLIKLQAIKKRWKNGFDEIFVKLDFISSQYMYLLSLWLQRIVTSLNLKTLHAILLPTWLHF